MYSSDDHGRNIISKRWFRIRKDAHACQCDITSCKPFHAILPTKHFCLNCVQKCCNALGKAEKKKLANTELNNANHSQNVCLVFVKWMAETIFRKNVFIFLLAWRWIFNLNCSQGVKMFQNVLSGSCHVVHLKGVLVCSFGWEIPIHNFNILYNIIQMRY